MNSSIKRGLKRFLAGIMIGVGGILPGVSGSVLAVAFGLYGKILDAVATFFKDVRGNLRFLLPVGLGGVVGLYGVAILLNNLMGQYEVPLVFLFCGLVAGSMPSLVKEAKAAGGPIKKQYSIAMAAGFALSMLMLLLGGGESAAETVVGPYEAAVAGAILITGTILPGMSMSFLLIRLGWYAPLMSALSSLNIGLLLWCGVGVVIAGAVLIGGVRWLLKHYPGWMYSLVIGLMAGTIITSLPHVPMEAKSLVYVLPFVIGAVLAWLMAFISDNGEE